MRIVAHNGAAIWGGAERATVTLLEGLAGRGHEVLLLCNAGIVASEARRRDVPVRICVLGGDIAIPHAVRLAGVLKKIAPDAFIVGTYRKLFLATLGARLARVPRVIARIGLETDTPRSAKYRFALRRWTDAVVVNAERMIAPFAELGGFGRDKVELIHNGVRAPSPRGEPGAVRNEHGIAAGAFVIGTVARLARQKRIDRLLDAVSGLPDDVHCLIAGDGEERTRLEVLATGPGQGKRVHFTGMREDIADVLDALDVFVVTSDREGLSNAMLEAMSRGLPVISTPVSGAEDALGPGDDGEPAGIVSADFSATTIAQAVMTLRDDAARRKTLGEAARERADTVFSTDRMLDKWEALLSRPVRL
jgi:glycosyltransferase involved in cell wall biosynthesis